MIIYKEMDITTVEKGIVAHGVNAQFVMGAGVALAIRTKWPIVYNAYIKYKGVVPINQLLGNVLFVSINSELTVANCFTQIYYGRATNVKYASPNAIRTCLEHCINECNSLGLDLYMPRIGCNLGGLSWSDDVHPIVEEISEKLDDNLLLYVCNY